MRKIVFINLLAVLFLSSGFIFEARGESLESVDQPIQTNENVVTLDVPGMFCPSCPFIVRKTLEGIEGAIKVETSLETRTAVVTHDKSKVSVKQLKEALKNVGYPAT